MHKKILPVIAMIATASQASAQSAKDPLVLKPVSSWHVDYADDRCRLGREFGEGEQQTYLFLDRYGPGEYFRLLLAGKEVRSISDKTEATVQFGPTEKEQQLHFFRGNLAKLPALVFTTQARIAPPSDADVLAIKNKNKGDDWIDLELISAERQKAVKYLSFDKPLRRQITLQTGSMRAPLVALDKCIDNLMTTWGIDVEKHRTLSRALTPQQSPGKWVVSQDYPLNMLSAGQPALVEFRLSVGADGVPTACHIQSTTRPKEFDEAVCKSVMRRARFDPALDAMGKPLASYYRNTVRFQIP